MRDAREPADAHHPLPDGLDLQAVFCHEETRAVGNDWTVRYNRRIFQIARQRGLPPAGKKIVVQEWRDGSVHLLYQGRVLSAREIDHVEPRAPRPRKPTAPAQPRDASEDHSWRTGHYLPTDTATALEQREDLARTYLPPPAVAGIPVGIP